MADLMGARIVALNTWLFAGSDDAVSLAVQALADGRTVVTWRRWHALPGAMPSVAGSTSVVFDQGVCPGGVG